MIAVVTAPLNVQNNLPQVRVSLHKWICHRHKPVAIFMFPKYQTNKLGTINALNVSLSGLVGYAYPPTALLISGTKICQCNCLLILLALGWPGMHWFQDLVKSINKNSTLITCVSNTTQTVKQPGFYLQYLNLYSWCLGVSNSKNKVSVVKWQRELLPLKGH